MVPGIVAAWRLRDADVAETRGLVADATPARA